MLPLPQAMRLTMVQVLINSKGLNMNPIQSLYYVSPACFICLGVPFRESLEQAPRAQRPACCRSRALAPHLQPCCPGPTPAALCSGPSPAALLPWPLTCRPVALAPHLPPCCPSRRPAQ